MNATANEVQSNEFDNNSANLLAKQSKGAKGAAKQVKASEGTKLPLTEEGKTLVERQEDSAKKYVSLRKRTMNELKLIGDTLVETRLQFPSKKIFGQELAKTPLKVIARQDVFVLMRLSTHWVEIQALLKEEKIKFSISPRTLTDNFLAFKKAETESNDSDDQTESAETPSASEKQSNDEIASTKHTEDSVAKEVSALIQQNELDLDLIVDKIRDILKLAVK